MTFQTLRKLRADHLKALHDLSFYPYQEVISDSILAALIKNLSITKDSAPEDIERLEQAELGFEISRQAGKTWAVGYTNEFIMSIVSQLCGRPIRIGIFAPQIDQAKLSYEITRNALRPIKGLTITDLELKNQVREEENAKKLVLPNGSSCVIAPITTTSHIEGLALDLIIVDEAQDADDQIVQHSIWPMGKSTNAPRAYIGKAGTKTCHFLRLRQESKSYLVYFDKVAQQRQQLYEKTGDARHLIYAKSVNEDITRYSKDSDFIKREYFGEWQIGSGQFVIQEDLEAIESERSITHHENKHDCYVGIDTAKHPDSTVVTILRDVPEERRRQIIAWLELRGDNYQDQFDIINDFISRYRVQAIAIDSTGQGDFMPDMFEAHTEYKDENSGLFRVKFSMASKDQMYKNLKVVIKELLTDLPKLDTKIGRRFKEQLLDLQQEYKGQFLSVKHPDNPNAHDDFPDSWALAEWAYAQWVQADKAQIASVAITEPPRAEVVKDDAGRVIEHWPGDSEW